MYANISFTEFLFSNSGHVKSHEALSLGWVAGILSGIAALIGMPNQASADPCNGVTHGSCAMICGVDCGGWEVWRDVYCHHMYPDNHCKRTSSNCGC